MKKITEIMNRVIKFRAWDSFNNIMLSWEKFKNIKFDIGDGYEVGIPLDILDEKYQKQHRLKPLQFTGLKDKNGKEIYEGDIITNYGVTKEMKTMRYEVVFTEDRARFSAYDLSSKWNTSISSYDMKQCEVIGNKYENPELLNK